MLSSSTIDPFSVAPSRHRIELASLRPLILMLSFPVSDNQTLLVSILSLGDIPVVLLGIYGRWHRPHIQITPTSGRTPRLVLGAQSQNPGEPVVLVDDF